LHGRLRIEAAATRKVLTIALDASATTQNQHAVVWRGATVRPDTRLQDAIVYQ